MSTSLKIVLALLSLQIIVLSFSIYRIQQDVSDLLAHVIELEIYRMNQESFVRVEDGKIVYRGRVYDTTEMTGKVVDFQLDLPGTICVDDTNACLPHDVIEFTTEDGGSYVLYPERNWVGLNKRNINWHESAEFPIYSLAIGVDGETLPEINRTTVAMGDWQRDFGRTVWEVEVSPDGLYVLVLMPPISGDQDYETFYYFGHAAPGFSFQILSAENGQFLYGSEDLDLGSDWLEPEHDYVFHYGNWFEAVPYPSPDGRFTAYVPIRSSGEPFLSTFIYKGNDPVQYLIGNQYFSEEGYGWWFSGTQWQVVTPENSQPT
jgi:hypothetical protein